MNNSQKNIMVSVAVPFYNQESYIKETINSVLSQKTNFEFEIVAGDDCSKDSTRSILIDFQRQYPEKIRVLLNEKNLGLVLNVKNILDQCKGKYIALLGGDDLFCNEDKLQKQFDFLEQNPDFGFVHSNARLLIKKNNNIYDLIESADDFLKRNINTGNVFEYLIRGNFVLACTAFFRRELYSAHADLEGWHKLKFNMEDYPMWLTFSRVTKFGYINESLSTYRIAYNTVSRPKDRSTYLIYWVSSLNVSLYFIDKYEISDDTRSKFFNKYNLFYLEYGFHFRKPDIVSKSIEYFKNSGNYKNIYYLYYLGSQSIIVWFLLKVLRRLFKQLQLK